MYMYIMSVTLTVCVYAYNMVYVTIHLHCTLCMYMQSRVDGHSLYTAHVNTRVHVNFTCTCVSMCDK